MHQGIIDVHAHILPGIDDGARDWQEAEAMLGIAISMGIRTIIATPHSSRHLPCRQIEELSRELSERADKACPGFRVYPGQELLYFDSLVDALKAGELLTLAGSRYVLVEFMPGVPYQKLYQGIRKLLLAGYHPVLAHVERYEALRQEKALEELLLTGCLLQMNHSSLEGPIWDFNVRWCRSQVKKGRVHLLGTDMHHSGKRSPEIRGSLDWLNKSVTKEEAVLLLFGRGLQILQGAQLPVDK